MIDRKVIDSMLLPRMNDYINKMKEKQLDYLFVYFNGLHSFLEPNQVFLLSGFKSIGECMLIVSAKGESTLIVSPSWDVERAKETSKTTNVVGTDHLVSTFIDLLTTENALFTTTGFIGIDSINPESYSRISAYFSNEINEVTDDFKSLTDTKSDEEIENARKATWIAERGYEKVLEIAKPGMYDYQLAGELVSYMKSLGADDNFLLMSASQHNQAVRPPGRRRLEKGDIILAEISPSFKGQFSQICRSVVLGDNNLELLTEKYNLLVHAMKKGIEVAKPGNKMSDVVRAINEPIIDAGYGEYCVPPYMRVRGHSLGLSSLLPGDVSITNETILKEGMFFVIHPNQYIPETGYLLCGEPVLITSKGAEPLTRRLSNLDSIRC
ncbi:M24 family metallopeptidase [Bacillus sp. Marseille-P3661]|uniref:M24 family metallopeptidase n=1 Tax=Bacillus sp. Marseille-P3661 TaxID=1936234 RepID=UPI000C83B069|nr:Xaa-Pro peptidase family protein [Bacillus sp. Marseille-P3661]